MISQTTDAVDEVDAIHTLDAVDALDAPSLGTMQYYTLHKEFLQGTEQKFSEKLCFYLPWPGRKYFGHFRTDYANIDDYMIIY